MGVCCIFFDIDGMFEFFMNILNIEKNKILRIFFQYFIFSSRFMLFPALKKSFGIKKIKFRGGGVDFFLKQFFLISRFMLFSTLKKYWKVPLHLLVKLEVVSPNSREGQLESISIISSIPLFWFCISNVGVVWGGGGVIWEYKPIISHLMFSSCFFCMLEILKSAPSLTATG